MHSDKGNLVSVFLSQMLVLLSHFLTFLSHSGPVALWNCGFFINIPARHTKFHSHKWSGYGTTLNISGQQCHSPTFPHMLASVPHDSPMKMAGNNCMLVYHPKCHHCVPAIFRVDQVANGIFSLEAIDMEMSTKMPVYPARFDAV